MEAGESGQQSEERPQCRICLDGEEPSLGRLIRPCLCKGSISYVHVKCLQTWRTSSASDSAFFKCPQCSYSYRFSRTRISGVASNPIIIAAGSALLFTVLVLCSSFVTTSFLSAFDEDDYPLNRRTSFFSSYTFFNSPFDVGQDLIRAFLRIVKDELGIIDDTLLSSASRQRIKYDARSASDVLDTPTPSLFKRFITRFLLGLPVVGAASIVHLLLSMPILGPVHWIARYRGNRRRGDSKDIASIDCDYASCRRCSEALYKVYAWTEKTTKRLLLRAEDAILEVSA